MHGALTGNMTPLGLLCAFAVGSALLAAWLDVTFEARRPEGLRTRLFHVLASSLALQGVVQVFALVAGGSGRGLQLAALVALVLPGLVYGFLSGIWLVRAVRERMPA